ncbi:hypothetical protein ACFYNA_15355 [Streptomyces sp. NPDC006640]|uniref:hypothetical protein n=1 Tax=Streptomyces sp. NPDC006640 TaxID=3364754 RepID=UPI00369B0669
MRKKTYSFTAAVSDGKRHDGEVVGTVEAVSEEAALSAIAESVVHAGQKRWAIWRASNIKLS